MATCKECMHYDVCQYHIDEETKMTINECGNFISTADVVEVKHGEWSVRKYSCSKFITCSVCNGGIGSSTGIDENKFKYCPFCGARMKEGVK